MLILSSPSKLRLLEEMLQKIQSQSLVVCGAVMNINRGNPFGYEVIVDSWPEFKAILTRPRREVPSDDSDVFANTYTAFYRDQDAYRTLLLESDAVNWSQCFTIRGNQDGIYEASRNAAAAKQMRFSSASYIPYLSPDPNKLRECKLDAGFRLSSLNHSHVDLLNETWPYGGSKPSHQYLAKLVRCFPNICILDVSGHPVSWVLMDPFGAGAHNYTLQSHRGRGFSSVVLRALTMQASAAGYLWYGFVAPENIRMQKIQEHLGYQRLPHLCHVCVHHTV
ncbi:glycine N-acyltransferase-like protein 3 [Tiliqua scincoides]|uniref:glycine N-acyltransferase-like protein 3 n=1 Tax=Tiliqua scincoides TaxID=71010 RepID=UPI0034625710